MPGDLRVGTVAIRWNSLPKLGNTDFRLGRAGGRARTLALLFFSLGSASTAIQGCTLNVDGAKVFLAVQMQTNANGSAIQKFAIPNDANLIGLKSYVQWVNQDSQSKNLQLIGAGASTAGAEVLLGR